MKYYDFLEKYRKEESAWPFNFAVDVVDAEGKANPEKVAMIWLDEHGNEKRLTYADFTRESNKAANVLRSLGVQREDIVVLMMTRRVEWWICALAIMKLGAIVIPVSSKLTPYDIRYRSGMTPIKAIITEDGLKGVFDEASDDLTYVHLFLTYDGGNEKWQNMGELCANASEEFKDPADTTILSPMIMYFTSGTSGLPKMVRHNYLYAWAHLATSELWHRETPESLQWTITDTGWGKLCWGAFIAQWMAGSCIFVYEYKGHFDGKDILRNIEKYHITNFCAPPTVYRLLIAEDVKKYDISSLKVTTAAGEALSIPDANKWKELSGLDIYEGYGQTESTILLGNLPGEQHKIGSLGRSIPGLDVDIVDDEGNRLGPDKEGNIAVCMEGKWPPGLFHGYLNEEEMNKEVFHHGWYYTRDLGIKDKDGFIWFVSRSDDVFKSSGYRISPAEVEKALQQHEAVADSIVIGVPHKMRGFVVKAFVQLRPGFEPSFLLGKDIQSFVRKNTAPYMYPRIVEFVDDLPKTTNGKKCRWKMVEIENKKNNG